MTTATITNCDVYIVAVGRTPLGSLMGSLTPMTAVQLGAAAVKGTLARSPVDADQVDAVYFGNVVSAGTGQNPARQVAVHAGIPHQVPCTTINKVCASGLKAITLGALTIRAGDAHVVVAGGTESMTNAPHLVPNVRTGIKYGPGQLLDALSVDGLSDAFDLYPMGVAAEATNREFALTRQQQDDYSITSYTRAIAATESGLFHEIIPIDVPVGRGKPPKTIKVDDQPSNFAPDKIPTLRPVFEATGSVTAANASPISDGAAAVVLVSGAKLKSLIAEGRLTNNSGPVFKLVSSADAEQEPIKFTTTPATALKLALTKAHLTVNDLDVVELNEAFACVALANQKLLPDLDPAKINIYGGAVALGHPLGASGARILTTLTTILTARNARFGAAAICNGGGGATACIIERIPTLVDIPETHL